MPSPGLEAWDCRARSSARRTWLQDLLAGGMEFYSKQIHTIVQRWRPRNSPLESQECGTRHPRSR